MVGRVLLADDHPAVRKTLRALLTEVSVGICGEAENGRQAIDKACELQPDVVVLDLVMPDMNGLDAAYEIRQRSPSSKIILISLHFPPEDGLAFANALLISEGGQGFDVQPGITAIMHTIERVDKTRGMSILNEMVSGPPIYLINPMNCEGGMSPCNKPPTHHKE